MTLCFGETRLKAIDGELYENALMAALIYIHWPVLEFDFLRFQIEWRGRVSFDLPDVRLSKS